MAVRVRGAGYHLGNTRVCFADRNGNGRIELPGELPAQPDYTETLQENHYYTRPKVVWENLQRLHCCKCG